MKTSIKIYSYSACSTCKKALKWLNDKGLCYELFDITKTPPSKASLQMALAQLGDRKLLFNTRGVSYRNLGAEVVKKMSNHEALNALFHDGKLIKRPFLITSKGKILVGYKEDVWSQNILG
tara:strand:+ start:147 stop:509 length:363 start_codon:yes stop_codon:yes gene_type:complete